MVHKSTAVPVAGMILYSGRGRVKLPAICIDNLAFICVQKGEKLYPGIRYIMDYMSHGTESEFVNPKIFK